MNYFPAFVDLTKFPVAIIGGGEVAQRKLEVLLKFTTDIRLVSKSFDQGIKALATTHKLDLIQADYCASLIPDVKLVIAATDSAITNEQVAIDAKHHHWLVNVVDQPELCDYITPAIIDRDSLCIALSSGGKSPVLLGQIRSRLEAQLPFELGALVDFCDRQRDVVKQQFDNLEQRRLFWSQFLSEVMTKAKFDSAFLELTFKNRLTDLQPPAPQYFSLDTHLISVDDINLRAIKRMQQADLVIIGNDVDPEYIELCRRDAEKVPATNFSVEDLSEKLVVIAFNTQIESSDIPVANLMK